MKCQNCSKNEANVHLKQNINGQISEFALCSECAEKLGVGGMFKDFGGFGSFGLLNGFDPFSGIESFNTLLGGMFGKAAPGALPQVKQCKLCGSTFAEIAERGQVGCPECYDEFGERLSPSIERLHGRSKHIGKLPGRPAKVADEERAAKKEPAVDKITELRTQLNAAINNEEYEKAAVLRDRIKELENR